MAADATWNTPNPAIQAMSRSMPSQNNMGSCPNGRRDVGHRAPRPVGAKHKVGMPELLPRRARTTRPSNEGQRQQMRTTVGRTRYGRVTESRAGWVVSGPDESKRLQTSAFGRDLPIHSAVATTWPYSALTCLSFSTTSWNSGLASLAISTLGLSALAVRTRRQTS
jgi:hypothetical protein